MGIHVVHGFIVGCNVSKLTERQIHNCLLDSYAAINIKHHLDKTFIPDLRLWGRAENSINGLIFDYSNLGVTIKRICDGSVMSNGLIVATDIEAFFTFARQIFDQATIYYVSALATFNIETGFKDIHSYKTLKDKMTTQNFKEFNDSFVALRDLRGLFTHRGKTPTIIGDKFFIDCALPPSLENLKTKLNIQKQDAHCEFPIETTIRYFSQQMNGTLNELGKSLNEKLKPTMGNITCTTAIEGDIIPTLKPFLI